MTMKVVVLYFLADKSALAAAMGQVKDIATAATLTVDTVRDDCQVINVPDQAAADNLLSKLHAVAGVKADVELDAPKTIPVKPATKDRPTEG